MTTAALYARISLDELGLEKGVTRQLEDVHQLAEQRGWTVAGEYVDNDVSAFNGDMRESYLRLMADAEAGRFERIVVYMTSRLWRNRSERAHAITRLGQLRIGVAAVKGPDLDLTTAYGRGLAGLMGEFDTMESEVKGERVARAALQRAQEGKAHGPVAYGWRRQYQTDAAGRIIGFDDVVNPDQAVVVRDIVDRLISGEPLRGIVRYLNAGSIPTPNQRGKWHPTMVTQLARRPSNAGLRVYKGEIMGPGAWTGIVDRDKHDRVVALLDDPARRQSRDGARKHLLSFGIGECGVCGAELAVKTILSGRATTADRRRYPIYVCNSRNCVTRDQAKVDELVGAVVVERLLRSDAAGIFDSDDTAAIEARERAEAVRARLDSAADQYAEGAIDASQLARITARLRPELAAAEADARRQRPVAVPVEVDQLHGDRAADVWAALPVTAKRSVMQVLGLAVVIMPRQKAGPGFDPQEIIFRWGA